MKKQLWLSLKIGAFAIVHSVFFCMLFSMSAIAQSKYLKAKNNLKAAGYTILHDGSCDFSDARTCTMKMNGSAKFSYKVLAFSEKDDLMDILLYVYASDDDKPFAQSSLESRVPDKELNFRVQGEIPIEIRTVFFPKGSTEHSELKVIVAGKYDW